MKLRLLVISWTMVLTGCASISPVGLIYTNTTLPQSWRSNTLEDVKQLQVIGPVQGESCATNILGLVATGDAGYNAAVTKALESSPGAVALYDVRTDGNLFSILGVYTKYCTIVSGQAVGTGTVGVHPPLQKDAVSRLVFPESP